MKVVSIKDSTGKVSYSSEIVKGVVECAICEIDGICPFDYNDKKEQKLNHNNIRIDYIDDFLYIDVFVKLAFNVNVGEVASRIQKTIKNALETMTEFRVKDINVHVIDVDFLEQNN
ncbi:MAG: Asp23/Gls24 family envelope stress response protein [Clostridia bacterium]|nr:Asp23/Gls24 family envelope stress response protein [Clostridia bacterium]